MNNNGSVASSLSWKLTKVSRSSFRSAPRNLISVQRFLPVVWMSLASPKPESQPRLLYPASSVLPLGKLISSISFVESLERQTFGISSSLSRENKSGYLLRDARMLILKLDDVLLLV